MPSACPDELCLGQSLTAFFPITGKESRNSHNKGWISILILLVEVDQQSGLIIDASFYYQVSYVCKEMREVVRVSNS